MNITLLSWREFWVLGAFRERAQLVVGDSRVKLELVPGEDHANVSVKIDLAAFRTGKSEKQIYNIIIKKLWHNKKQQSKTPRNVDHDKEYRITDYINKLKLSTSSQALISHK